ncbi:LemA family protein [Hornefia butyriciproducens]|jgi:LemA protein|uniref:LemA family protein n=1 Tax=Hornefia butyriciproducens TaxID=2652293 RepID=A0A6L5Y505_9FIRM|nr:LemA family protein [Hornefia butyriciproducens]MCI7326641.1 LemA family protein [Clostridiales bacterium]MCI7412954.1 LemA family protein [Clostridiales bacterium]MDD6299976.1 LemA family protein [Hornefia butyriciproducens]MDY2991881.1 LemA family protein [Hornefia butyriciproducens]MDY5424158.1 LemA family protein [Hornefia butyriciproducens]
MIAIAGIIIAVIVGVIVVWLIAAYNGFVRANNNCEEAFATMDVYMKKRYDLIPNLVETVKGYAAHESNTLQKVVEARNMAQSASTVEERAQAENILSGTLKSLFAISEAYPDLKANQNFMDLQSQLQRIEDEIANSRKYYNAVVKIFNNKCQMFPSNIIANVFHYTRKPMFEVENEEERRNVKVDFNA